VLRRDDLVAPSVQDKNAGNSGDLVKHSGYLALIRELARTPPSDGRLDIVEAHGGKGVYVSAHRHLMAARQTPGYGPSVLGSAQSSCFESTTGLGPVLGLQPGEIAYAGSAALDARLVREGIASSLTVLDGDAGERAGGRPRVLAAVFLDRSVTPSS
jgi:23S rRNA A2030 N6-methylase RlmJ